MGVASIIKRIVGLTRKVFVIGFGVAINFLKFKYHGVKCESFPRTRGIVVLSATQKGRIAIGRNVTINSGRKMNPVGMGFQTALLALRDGKIQIGNNVGMSNVAIVSMESITIEDNVMIGNGAVIYDTDFHSMHYEKRCQKYDDDIATKPVVIKEGAFIGAGVIVLKGVTIGEHSIIGAGSVVTKSIPPHQVWAGNPARYIKDTLD